MWLHIILLMELGGEKIREQASARSRATEEKEQIAALSAAGGACHRERSILILQIHAFAVKSIMWWHVYCRFGILADWKNSKTCGREQESETTEPVYHKCVKCVIYFTEVNNSHYVSSARFITRLMRCSWMKACGIYCLFTHIAATYRFNTALSFKLVVTKKGCTLSALS